MFLTAKVCMPVYRGNKRGLLPGRCSSAEYLGRGNPSGASGCQELQRRKKSRLGAWGPVLGEKRPDGNQSGLRQPRKCLACPLGLLVSHQAFSLLQDTVGISLWLCPHTTMTPPRWCPLPVADC